MKTPGFWWTSLAALASVYSVVAAYRLALRGAGDVDLIMGVLKSIKV